MFLAAAGRVTSEQEAQAFLQGEKHRYPDAGHHVYAWIIGGEAEQRLQRFSDDGEPQGTAGPPVLDVLAKANIVDTIIVVSRYFGGTLLGTGGLVKAYGSAASAVIAAAGLCAMVPGRRYTLRFPYRFVDIMQYQLGLAGVEIEEKSFSADVTFDCLVELTEEAAFLQSIENHTQGQARAAKGEVAFLPKEIKED